MKRPEQDTRYQQYQQKVLDARKPWHIEAGIAEDGAAEAELALEIAMQLARFHPAVRQAALIEAHFRSVDLPCRNPAFQKEYLEKNR